MVCRYAARTVRPWRWRCRVLAIAIAIAWSPWLAFAGPADFYENAARLYAGNDLRAAVIELKNALNEDPDHLPSRLLLGRIYVDNGLGADAEQMLRRARGLGGDSAAIDLLLAEAYLLQDEPRNVLSLLPPAMAADARLDFMMLRARAHLALLDFDAAGAEASAAAALFPESAEPRAMHVRILNRTRGARTLEVARRRSDGHRSGACGSLVSSRRGRPAHGTNLTLRS